VGVSQNIEVIDGTAESYVVANARDRVFGWASGFATMCVIGYRNHVPSNAGIVRVGHAVQQETAEIPFTDNTMPNWRKWETEGSAGSVRFLQKSEVVGRKLRPGDPRVPSTDHIAYYQWLHIEGDAGEGGIYRKFLGLIPGNAYRLRARVSTSTADDATGEWSYSFHACPGYPDGREFTAEQFAGVGPLPDGTKGRDAARVVAYGPDYTTEGQCVEISTGDKGFPGQTIGDITLPEDVTEIVLWIRHTGTDTSGVGLDWVRLEDLSVTGG
jgi:hypothetical protein